MAAPPPRSDPVSTESETPKPNSEYTSVDCPECGAKAGRPCPGEAVPYPHGLRWREFRAASGESGKIAVNPEIKAGLPCLSGTRIPTHAVFQRHVAGESDAEIMRDYETLTLADINAAVQYELTSMVRHLAREVYRSDGPDSDKDVWALATCECENHEMERDVRYLLRWPVPEPDMYGIVHPELFWEAERERTAAGGK